MKKNDESINIGEYKFFKNCRFCFSENTEIVIDLGHVPLAGGFIKKGTAREDLKNEKFYPLQIAFCKKCKLLQVNTSVNPDTLFKNYFYFSSSIGTLVEYFENFALEIEKEVKNPKKTHVVEIGCNDGSLVKSFLDKGFITTGVDPATNVVNPLIKKGYPILNEYFDIKTAKKIIKQKGKADLIVSFHTMAHIENMHNVVAGIKKLLKKNGELRFEVHYLGNLILEKQYDMMYHEHQFYYSLHSLINFFNQFDMEIFDVKLAPVRGGSIMYYVQHKNGGKKISKNVSNLIKYEKTNKLQSVETFREYSAFIERTKRKLLKTLDDLKEKNKKIVGYGASGRGTIIMNHCGLNNQYFSEVIDDAPAKHGSLCPGTHQKIISSKILEGKSRPDYCVLFAWPFVNEVVKKNISYLKTGGKFIAPLPKVKVIENEKD